MNRDIDDSSENVLSDWSRRAEPPTDPVEAKDAEPEVEGEDDASAWGTAVPSARPELVVHAGPERDAELDSDPAPVVPGEPAAASAHEHSTAASAPEPDPSEPTSEPQVELETPMAIELSQEHAAGELEIPDGYAVLEGAVEGGRRAVGVVVSRFNGEVTSRLLDRALEELAAAGVRREAITIMVVPGAFELPLAATALAKTRRFACIVALGCVIRGDTPHFDYVASEAASGLQLAALETGVPVSFGVLTLDRVEQADPRVEKGAEAVRSALEMADVFSQLRAAAAR